MSESNAKYKQVYETLKSSILSGKYCADRPMPSLRSLVRQHGFSTITIRHAFDELERQGLIARHRGRGTFVSRSGSARKIGLIVPGVAYSEFFPPIVSEISRLAQENEYTLLFGDIASKRPEKRASMAKKLAREFAEQGGAGVLYQPLEFVEDVKKVNRDILSVFDRAQIPVVILDNDFVQVPERSEYDVVGIDNVAAGVLAAEHLLSLGARKIHFQRRPRCSSSVNNRMRGVMSALNLMGLPMRMSAVLTAETLAKNKDGAGVFFLNRYGRGMVYSLIVPMESILYSKAGGFSKDAYKVYGLVAPTLQLIRTGVRDVTATEHYFDDGQCGVVVVNNSPAPYVGTPKVEGGWAVKTAFTDDPSLAKWERGQLTLGPNSGILLMTEKVRR